MYKSDLVYRYTCPQTECNESKKGETERRLKERFIDHNRRDKNLIFTNIVYFWFNNFEVIGRNHGNQVKRKISKLFDCMFLSRHVRV